MITAFAGLLLFATTATAAVPTRQKVVTHHHHHSHHLGRRHEEPPPLPRPRPTVPDDVADQVADGDRAYLRETARPGYTMTAQGVERALSCLHPVFVSRLAAAIAEARDSGIAASIFSACRPPAMRVGGFEDKFRSMHAYGLAVDMAGIGRPDSSTSRRWHTIAAAHGVYGVYGAGSAHEWNHYQATRVLAAPPVLRSTITAWGPRFLDDLFVVAFTFLDKGFALVMQSKKHHWHKRLA